MPTRKDPASEVVAFFETAALEEAAVVLAIVKGVVARRQGRTQVPRLKKGAKTASVPDTKVSGA